MAVRQDHFNKDQTPPGRIAVSTNNQKIMNTDTTIPIHATGEATGFIPAPGDKGKPITVIGTNSIRAGFDANCLKQALNSRGAPGVTDWQAPFF